MYISDEERLENFSIIVGPNNGKYQKCGSSNNAIPIGETTAFLCEAHASGTSLKIQINGRRQFLTLCEVLIFGTGMVVENSCFALNETYYIIYLKIYYIIARLYACNLSFIYECDNCMGSSVKFLGN